MPVSSRYFDLIQAFGMNSESKSSNQRNYKHYQSGNQVKPMQPSKDIHE